MSFWRVGMKLTAARLNSIDINNFNAAATVDLGVNQSQQAITGATYTIVTLADNVQWWAHGVFDFDAVTSGSASPAIGELTIDGVLQSGQAITQSVSASANARDTNGQIWDGILATAGSYTFTLVGTTPSGGYEINAVHTRLRITTKGDVETP